MFFKILFLQDIEIKIFINTNTLQSKKNLYIKIKATNKLFLVSPIFEKRAAFFGIFFRAALILGKGVPFRWPANFVVPLYLKIFHLLFIIIILLLIN